MGMINLMRRALALLATTALVACGGGGGDSGDSLFGGGTSSSSTSATDLVVVLDRTTLPNSGSEQVQATVTAVDANRNALSGVPVQVSVDSDAIATVSGSTTDTSGQVTADVSLGSNRTLRTITVTAKSGSLARAQSFQVTASTGGSGVSASDLSLQLSRTLISNTGTETVTATAIALDANRNTLADIPVTFSVNGNATSTPSASTTNAQGIITSVITRNGDTSVRSVTVTATAGTLVRTQTFQVAAGGSTTVQAADLTLSLDKSQVFNSGSESVVATATAVDANRNALSSVPIVFTIDNNAVIAPAGTQTGSAGTLSATATIGADRSNRTITITATAGTLVRTASFLVTGARISSTLVPANPIAGSTGNQIQYRLLDNNSNPMVGQVITITAPGLPTVSGTTLSSGQYDYVYTAPSTPGSISVTAAAAGATQTDSVQVVPSSGASVPVVTTTISSASVSAAPNVVAVNQAGSQDNRTEIRALFLGANNAPIPNVRVRFDLNGDSNSIGGTLTSLGTTVLSDTQGVATTAYIPADRSSPTNGVTIRACYSPADFTDCSAVGVQQVTTNLTVTSEAVAVTIGTDELIGTGTGTYTKDFVVLVVDAAGNAKPDVQITPSVDLTAYYKGSYSFDSSVSKWVRDFTLDANQGYTWNAATSSWLQTGAPLAPTPSQGVLLNGAYVQPSCPNDDFNRNGARDTGEDLNQNGSLDPRKSDVSIRIVGSSTKTGTNGTLVVRLEYPRNYATWVDYKILIQAAGISGTEGRTSYVGSLFGLGNLPAVGTAFASEDVTPAFVVSPYGRSNSCLDDK